MIDAIVPIALVAVAFAALAILALRMRVLFKLSMKNLLRRKRRAVIVILGLLVGTALISSALVVGDTLEYIFTEDVLLRWGAIDEVVAQQSVDVYMPFNASYFDALRDNLFATGAPIDGIAPAILEQLTVRNEAKDLWAEPVTIIGLNSSLESGLGGMSTLDGKSVATWDLGPAEVFANQRLTDRLNVDRGSVLRIYFIQRSFNVTVRDILKDDGIANLDKQPTLIMSLETAQIRFQMPAMINLIRVSNTGDEETGVQYSDQVALGIASFITSQGWNAGGAANIKVQEVKKEGLDAAQQFSKDITQIFFIMGTFATVAGILLIINIFVMMAEERKPEMGVSRAVGMTRGQLTQTFLFEGAVYAAASSVAGAFVGLGLGRVVIYFMSTVGTLGQQDVGVTFHFEWVSIAVAFAVGVIITLVTAAIASWWISRLNIVRAIRGQQEPVPTRTTIVEAIAGALLLLGAVVAFLERSYPPANIAWVPLLIMAGMIVSMHRLSPRWTFTFGGLGIMAWVLGPKFVELDEENIFIPLVLAGLLLVLGGVLFVAYNNSALLRMIARLGGRSKGRPVLKTSLTYPMSKRFRTGMTLAMFSLIMFAISIISMIQAMQGSAISQSIPTQSGGYDFVAHTSTFQRIDDANWSKGMGESGVAQYIESVSNATVVPVYVQKPGGGGSVPYTLWGVDNVLIRTNEFGFKSALSSFVDRHGVEHPLLTQRDAWLALAENDSLALVDGNAASGTVISPSAGILKLDVGDVVRVSSDVGYRNFTILGILQQSLPGTMGLFVNQGVVLGNYSITWSAYFFQLKPGVSAQYAANRLTTVFVQYGLETVVVSEILGQVMETADRVLVLMQAYLGIGLVVGVAGLVVITIRAVVERRQQIGVLRAIGYTKRMVTASFLLEVSFVAAFGTAIGITLGVLLSYRVWSLFFQDLTPFIIPWLHFAIIAFIVGSVTVLATASPAVRASRTPPAEALRYTE